MKYTFLYLLLACFSVGCTYTNEDDLTYTEDLDPQTIISYQEYIKPIMDDNCVICHSSTPQNGASTSLTTYEDVVAGVNNNSLIGRISKQPGEPGAMPQGGPRLPQNLIDLIVQWENEGFNNE